MHTYINTKLKHCHLRSFDYINQAAKLWVIFSVVYDSIQNSIFSILRNLTNMLKSSCYRQYKKWHFLNSNLQIYIIFHAWLLQDFSLHITLFFLSPDRSRECVLRKWGLRVHTCLCCMWDFIATDIVYLTLSDTWWKSTGLRLYSNAGHGKV